MNLPQLLTLVFLGIALLAMIVTAVQLLLWWWHSR